MGLMKVIRHLFIVYQKFNIVIQMDLETTTLVPKIVEKSSYNFSSLNLLAKVVGKSSSPIWTIIQKVTLGTLLLKIYK